MSQLRPAPAQKRVLNLDNRLLVATVFVTAMALYLYGALRSAYDYGDPRFVIGYFTTELQVAAFLLLVTAWFFPPARIGFRWPQRGNVRRLLPLSVLLLCAMGTWIASRLDLPAGALVDNGTSVLILRTTLLVGLTEEWIFRGMLLVALSRWLGLRRGAAAALLLFGLFHLINIAAGVPPVIGAVQAVSTILIGSVFLLAAVGTQSLLVPIFAHALYDFAVIDMVSLSHAGASSVPIMAVSVVGFGAGVFSLIGIARLQEQEPYPP